MPILALVLYVLEYRAIIKQNEHIEKLTCHSITLSFQLMQLSNRLHAFFYKQLLYKQVSTRQDKNLSNSSTGSRNAKQF